MMTYPWLASGSIIVANGMISGSSFPETRNVRYPTPGTVNPDVTIWIADITNTTADILKWQLKPPSVLNGQSVLLLNIKCYLIFHLLFREFYVTSAGWVGSLNNQVSIVFMTRAQNCSVIATCFAPNWTCIEVNLDYSN